MKVKIDRAYLSVAMALATLDDAVRSCITKPGYGFLQLFVHQYVAAYRGPGNTGQE